MAILSIPTMGATSTSVALPPANERSLAVKAMILGTRDVDEMQRKFVATGGGRADESTWAQALGGYLEEEYRLSAPPQGWEVLFTDPGLLHWASNQERGRAFALSTLYEQLRLARQQLGMSSAVTEDEADFDRLFPRCVEQLQGRSESHVDDTTSNGKKSLPPWVKWGGVAVGGYLILKQFRGN